MMRFNKSRALVTQSSDTDFKGLAPSLREPVATEEDSTSSGQILESGLVVSIRAGRRMRHRP